MASKITDSGTPFSLATASTTSNSSLLISLLRRVGPVGRRLVGGFVVVGPAGTLAGLVRCETQRRPVGDQPRLVDVVEGHPERTAVDVEGDVAVLHRRDAPGEAAPAVLRQPQGHLRGLAGEAPVVIKREQRTIQARQIGRAHV